MRFFYLDKPIDISEEKKFGKVINHSQLSYAGSNFQNLILKSLNTNLEFVKVFSIEELDTAGHAIVWSSNIIFQDLKLQKLYLRKLQAVSFEFFAGDKESFIFKGRIKDLNKFLADYPRSLSQSSSIHCPLEKHLFQVKEFIDYQYLLSLAPQSRTFNEVNINHDWVQKKSSNIQKIEGEYSFLKNIPGSLKEYFPSVKNFYSDKAIAGYEVEYIDGLDLGVRYINQSIDIKLFQKISDILKMYFREAKLIQPTERIKQEPHLFIIDKNLIRFEMTKNLPYFDLLNTFVKNHTIFNDYEHLSSILNDHLIKNQRNINKAGLIFSHGDLCFSNMILSDNDFKLRLIDPRGGQEEEFLSPYYDFAKLSHSILGGYDFIMSNKAQIVFDDSMQARLKLGFDPVTYLPAFNLLAKEFNLDLQLIRLVEASLFLSMIPLHMENLKRVIMLVLRSSEIMKDLLES